MSLQQAWPKIMKDLAEPNICCICSTYCMIRMGVDDWNHLQKMALDIATCSCSFSAQANR